MINCIATAFYNNGQYVFNASSLREYNRGGKDSSELIYYKVRKYGDYYEVPVSFWNGSLRYVIDNHCGYIPVKLGESDRTLGLRVITLPKTNAAAAKNLFSYRNSSSAPIKGITTSGKVYYSYFSNIITDATGLPLIQLNKRVRVEELLSNGFSSEYYVIRISPECFHTTDPVLTYIRNTILKEAGTLISSYPQLQVVISSEASNPIFYNLNMSDTPEGELDYYVRKALMLKHDDSFKELSDQLLDCCP